MKKWKIVTLCVLGVATAAVLGVAVWQRNNIKAVYTVMTRDSDTIAKELEEQREQHRKELEDQAQIDVAPPTSQQTDDVFSGSATSQEVKDQLGISEMLEKGKAAGIIPDDTTAPPGKGESRPSGSGTSESPADTSPPREDRDSAADTATPASDKEPPADTPPPRKDRDSAADTASPVPAPVSSGETVRPAPEEPPELTADELINICVAELYSCHVDIMDTLRTLKEEARSQWRALPANERTAARKREIGFAGLEQCYELEVETDNRVLEILDRYRPLLKERGADTSILDVLWEQYVEEKSAEKAYYLDKYMK